MQLQSLAITGASGARGSTDRTLMMTVTTEVTAGDADGGSGSQY